jgi:3-oxoacyl-[acyl-carrier-protein] synthase II
MSLQYFRKPRTQARVVVTGVGAVTPLGLNMDETWQQGLKGVSGIGNITRFDASKFDVRFAGEVKGFNPDLYIAKKEQKKMDTFIHYALAATAQALQQANIDFTDELKEKTGVLVGSGMGGLPSIEEQFQRYLEKGPGRISPFFIPMCITNLAPGQISIQYGFKGLNYSITSACASGAHSIGEAFRYIRDGICDVMVTGGTESTVCPMAIGGFSAMKALSTRNDDPTSASRPFDKDRDGFVLSEGAAVLILESLEHATKRGAKILCEITGYGATSDANHMTNPAPEGAGGAAAIRMALKDAELNPEQIDYINAHGTSTPVGDGLETAGIKSVFKDHAKKLWVSSTKSMTGHALGAAGAIESAFCVNSIVHQMVPPTINLQNPSEDCDLDYVANNARDGKIHHVVNNSFGFGGTNSCLIFSKFSGS